MAGPSHHSSIPETSRYSGISGRGDEGDADGTSDTLLRLLTGARQAALCCRFIKFLTVNSEEHWQATAHVSINWVVAAGHLLSASWEKRPSLAMTPSFMTI